MIKAEKTIYQSRINIVDTKKNGDERYLRQLSKKEAIYLLRSLLSILLPINSELHSEEKK